MAKGGKANLPVDNRPGLVIKKHVDIGHNHSGSQVVIAVETNAGPVVLAMDPDTFAEHIRLCVDLMDMLDDATIDGLKPAQAKP